ncbi:MAG: hypothetical protein AAGC79_15670 [Pseudomonadota bacterium]
MTEKKTETPDQLEDTQLDAAQGAGYAGIHDLVVLGQLKATAENATHSVHDVDKNMAAKERLRKL